MNDAIDARLEDLVEQAATIWTPEGLRERLTLLFRDAYVRGLNDAAHDEEGE